jgi:hypothetical protein
MMCSRHMAEHSEAPEPRIKQGFHNHTPEAIPFSKGLNIESPTFKDLLASRADRDKPSPRMA